ncbi:uncharacterized protein LOC114242867 [Bombyx mandarina]|uniref:Uncharacterized protein LOC114242867 n=1 Tax=Bombyx mandarina TaxID=7092 RepID=A0A6J2JK82_BOMMA|nr:uncharacterized protein LOC114242867 [Bombyx mandarina]
MGCTSSAPAVVTPDASATERQKSIQFADSCDQTINSNEEIENSERHDTNNVLPQCDTLGQTIRLVKSDISLMETFPLKEDKNCQDVAEMNSNSEKELGAIVIANEEDKISTLEEVIEKVMELNHSDEMQSSQNEETSPINNSEDQNHTTQVEDTNVSESIGHIEANNEQDEHGEEAISPSLSESSRATRWEALADIAAELPASLTIDPLTGQIYSLAK